MAKKTKSKSPAGRRNSSNGRSSSAGSHLARASAGGPKTSTSPAATWGSNEVKDGSRGQRKRLKSKKRAESRKLVIEKVQKHFKVHRHGEALGDVSSLAAALEVFKGNKSGVDSKGVATGIGAPKVASAQSEGAAKRMGNKRRAHLARAEVGLFKQVLAHPDFRANAVAAVHMHLKNTMMASSDNAKM
jgi:hypothetical protein